MPPVPVDESERLRALAELDVLDSPAELVFESLVKAAALVCGVPISLISLVDRDRQWFKANVGLPGVHETSRELAFCAHTIMSGELLEVQDAAEDERFADNPLVTAAPYIRFYAGATLRLRNGAHVGTLCVIDREPRSLSGHQRQVLVQLANAAVGALEARQTARQLAESKAKFRALSNSAADAIITIDHAQRIVLFNAAAELMFACSAADAEGQPVMRFLPHGFEPLLGHAPVDGVEYGLGRAGRTSRRSTGVRSDGSTFPLEASVSHVTVDGQALSAAILRDVSERTRRDALAEAASTELRATNHRLQLASEQLSAAQRITHVGSWEFELASGDVRWSTELFRIADLPEQQGVPRYPAQESMYSAESWLRLTSAVTHCISTGTSYELELELVRPSGERRWTIARGEADLDANGKVHRLFGTLQDITELKRAREEQQRASERSQLATRAAAMGVWEWDVAQDLLIWDATMQQLWDPSAEHLEGDLDSWLALVHPEDRGAVQRELGAALESSNDLELTVRSQRRDGTVRHLRATATIRRDDAQRAVRVIGVCWDVTDQHHAEQAMRAKKALLMEFVRHAPAAIAMFDRDMRYLQASERWATAHTCSVEALIGNSHYALFADTPQHWRHMHRRVLAGEVMRSDEDLVRRADGTLAWYEWEARPWHGADGSVHGLTWFTKDITDKKAMEIALVAQKRDLERSNEAREQATAKLRGTLTLQRAIFESAGMALIAADATGKIEVFNRAAQDMLGYSEEEMLGSTPAVFHIYEEVAARAVELEAELGVPFEPGFEVFVAKARSGIAEQREWTYQRKDGTTFPVLLSVTALCAENGKIYGFLGVAADMTAIRRTQARLEDLSRRLQVATRGAGIGIWECDLTSHELLWDEQMYRLYGVDKARFSPSHEVWLASLHPDDRARAAREVEEAAHGIRAFDSTFRVVHADGKLGYIRAHAMVERDTEGAARRLIGTNWDVTKECEAERALEARTVLLHEFVKHAPAAIAMLDRDLRYVQTSDRWLSDYHLGERDLKGLHHYEVFPDIPERWKAIHQRVLAGEVASCDEDPFPREDGGTEWLQWEARPWYGDSGTIGGVVFSTQVITARKEMELRLRKQQAELERSNVELQQFAYVASHDLQEPLRAVAGCAQILAESYVGELDADADELIAHVVDGAERMRTLIHDLLALSRVNAHTREFSAVDLGEVCATAVANLQAAARESDAAIEIAPLPRLVGEHQQLVQLFQNLLGNALKYRGQRRPEIVVSYAGSATEHAFAVRDNGIGIEAQYFERIFGVFQRLHTRSEYAGTGIGLAICHKVVERHHGRIWVESVVGEGTTFHFALPREQPELTS